MCDSVLLSYKYYERVNAPPPILVVIKHRNEDSNDIKKVQFLTVSKEGDAPGSAHGSSVVVDLDFSAELDNISRDELEEKLKKLERGASQTSTTSRFRKIPCKGLKFFYKKHRRTIKVVWRTVSYTFLNFMYFAFGYVFFTHFQQHRGGLSKEEWLSNVRSAYGTNHNLPIILPLNDIEKMKNLTRIAELRCMLNKSQLTFWTSFDMCVSVITTVGWGYITPRTFLGKVFCMVYASFGVPLYIVVIGANGNYISHLAERIDFHLKYNFMYLELATKYIVVGVLVVVFIFLHTQTAYSSSRHGHQDENLKEWSWFESLYYSYISLTTIGFGDYFMPSASERHQIYNFLQAMALLISIIFGFALFTYAFNAYAEASRKKMKVLRAKYEALATRNAALALAGFYANSELMFAKSQNFISNNSNLKRMSIAFDGSVDKIALESLALKRMVNTWAKRSTNFSTDDIKLNKMSAPDNFEVTSMHSNHSGCSPLNIPHIRSARNSSTKAPDLPSNSTITAERSPYAERPVFLMGAARSDPLYAGRNSLDTPDSLHPRRESIDIDKTPTKPAPLRSPAISVRSGNTNFSVYVPTSQTTTPLPQNTPLAHTPRPRDLKSVNSTTSLTLTIASNRDSCSTLYTDRDSASLQFDSVDKNILQIELDQGEGKDSSDVSPEIHVETYQNSSGRPIIIIDEIAPILVVRKGKK